MRKQSVAVENNDLKNNELIGKLRPKNAQKTKFFVFFRYFLIFLAFYILGRAGINGQVYPFAFSFLYAMCWCSFNPLILGSTYIVASYLATFSLVSLLCAGVTSVFMIVCYYLHLRFKKPIKSWLMAIYCLISQTCYLYFAISGSGMFLFPIISVVLGILFFFAMTKFFEAIIIRGFSSRLTSTELICGGIFLMALSCGMATLNIYGFELIKLFAAATILFVCFCFDNLTTLVVSALMGVGAMLAANQSTYACVFVIWALVVCVFKFKNKFFPVLGLFAIEAALGFYFGIYGSYTWISALPVVIGSLIFIVIPNSVISEFSGYFSTSSDRLAMRNIVNRNREHLSRRLGELGDVFSEMNKVFRSMIKGGLSKEDAKAYLAQEVKERSCEGCPEINTCHRAKSEETSKLFDDFVTIAYERGRVGVLDIPPNLLARCSKTSQIIANTNELCEQYKKYAQVMTNIDASKILVAEQLGGMSKIMKSLSKEVSKNISFDAGRENKIADELLINDIITSDVVIYEQNYDIISATVVVREDCLNIEKIEKIVGKICGCRMKVSASMQSPKAGWIVLSLATAPKFDVVFGNATQTKTGSEISGDSFSVIRIENDKFMLALCDGMGSGLKAERASNLAMGLVENFYKAGFDSDTILSCVNKLLSIGSDEVFSALDMCVINLRDGTADLIKLGAPCGFIKRDGKMDIIEGSALPIGIVGDIQPYNKKVVLAKDDFIVLCTDGVSDSFMSEKDLSTFILENSAKNPQELADEIIKKAVENCKGVALDDMSVLVARIFRN